MSKEPLVVQISTEQFKDARLVFQLLKLMLYLLLLTQTAPVTYHLLNGEKGFTKMVITLFN